MFQRIIDGQCRRCGGTHINGIKIYSHRRTHPLNTSQFNVPAESSPLWSSASLGAMATLRRSPSTAHSRNETNFQIRNVLLPASRRPPVFVSVQLWGVLRRVNEPSRSPREMAPSSQRHASAASPSPRSPGTEMDARFRQAAACEYGLFILLSLVGGGR